MLTDLVDGDDARVIQTGRRLGLASKALDESLIGELATEQDFHSHHPIKAHLPGAINRPHASSRDFLE